MLNCSRKRKLPPCLPATLTSPNEENMCSNGEGTVGNHVDSGPVFCLIMNPVKDKPLPDVLGKTGLPDLFSGDFCLPAQLYSATSLVGTIHSHFDTEIFRARCFASFFSILPGIRSNVNNLELFAQLNLSECDFYNRLCHSAVSPDSSEVINIEDDKFSKYLEAGIAGKRFSKQLYIRRCYWELYYLTEIFFRTKLTDTVIITGNPGIGKSRFALFYMCMAAKLGKSFICHFSPDHGVLYLPGYKFEGTAGAICAIVRKVLIGQMVDYVFVDLVEKVSPNGVITQLGKKVILFVPPDPARYSSMVKHQSAMVLYMPLSTEDEIEDIFRLIQPFQNLVTEETMRRQLEVFGSIPRYCFDLAFYGDRYFKKAWQLDKVRCLLNLLLSERERDLIVDENDSLMIFHLDTVDYCTNYYKLASRRVLEEVSGESHRLLSQALDGCMKDKISPMFHPAVNNIFDAFGPPLLMASKQHTVKRLTDGSCTYGNTTIQAAPLAVTVPDVFDLDIGPYVKLLATWNGATIEDYKLYVQHKRSMLPVDCFMKCGRRLYIFQLTVSNHHGVKGEGLVDLLAKFPVGHITEVLLVFVCPEVGGITTLQPLHTAKGMTYIDLETIPAVLRANMLHCTQYVLNIATETIQALQTIQEIQ